MVHLPRGPSAGHGVQRLAMADPCLGMPGVRRLGPTSVRFEKPWRVMDFGRLWPPQGFGRGSLKHFGK